MANYDLQDPYDLATMNALFDNFSREDWEKYIELAIEKQIGFKNINVLKSAEKKTGMSKYMNAKIIKWVLNLIDDLDTKVEDDEKDLKSQETMASDHFKIPSANVTLRVAWHDNKWNGSICNDPENNTYCNGFHSLLSERIRKRKDENIENEIKYKGQHLNDIDYLPPCFWSINLFGNDPIKVKHDNPAAPNLKIITEELPKNSMYSWPFSVSFSRTQKENSESGAYPKNLEVTRVPRFNSKIQEGKSIAFMYAKYSNPITEEEQQYLVVGAGIVERKQKASEIPHFGPAKEIQEIRDKKYRNFKNRNFPSMNWAMQFSFEDFATIRMPYHEYLEEAEKLSDESKEGFLDKIKVAIVEPELEWCFKYVAMDIGDDETIYLLTKMRKALISCKDDGVVSRQDMQERIDKVEELLKFAWESRSYFPGFSAISRVLLHQTNEPDFPLEAFYEEFKNEEDTSEKALLSILQNNTDSSYAKEYGTHINDLNDRLEQRNFSLEQFLKLSMLNLKPFQFERLLSGKLKLPDAWVRTIDDVKYSHDVSDIIANPYLLYEDYQYWPDSHDDVYGEELDAPIDLFKIDIAYFPDTRIIPRTDMQRDMKFVDKRRIRALILRHLNTLENKGDCFSSANTLQNVIQNYPLYYELGSDYQVPDNFFYPLTPEYANHYREEDPKKLVLVEANDTMYYYLAKVYDAEKSIEESISDLLNASTNNEQFPNLDNYISECVIKLRDKIGQEFRSNIFTDERQELFTNIFAKKLFVVAGSAGSGKSYEVLKIIKHLEEKENQKYLLLAPTGKAALRLSSDSDFANIKASTIDKFINDVLHRKIKQSELKEYKNIIVDESSMVDLLKFEKLLRIFNFKEPSFKRLILIGDPNQLPAIGYGRVLADVISYLSSNNKYSDNFIQLETNCRSELVDNDVLRLAEAFKVNVKEDIDNDLKQKLLNQETVISNGFRARYWSDKDVLYNQIREEFEILTEDLEGDLNAKLNQVLGLSAKGGINKSIDIENFQILSPYHSQYSGASKINDFIQSDFKRDLNFELRKNVYKAQDKILRTKNYYENKKLILSNGTLGLIKKDKVEKFYFNSQKGLDEIAFSEIRGADNEFFELAYAITIHKSQGSGFNHLFLVLPARYGLLSKELVYTALTRTKKSITLFIQTSEDEKKSVLDRAMERSFSASRRTSLLLDKPYRFYDLEPELGVYVESRVELLIYHMLMNKRDELGKDVFDFAYEEKPIIDGEEINIKTDFTVYANGKTWYWEHLGLLGQRKYTWTWQNLKKKTYQSAKIWEYVITTDETNGINPKKIENLIDLIIEDSVMTEDKFDLYSNHHYYLR
jgi:exodeoxyribonuclease V alpha subunit